MNMLNYRKEEMYKAVNSLLFTLKDRYFRTNINENISLFREFGDIKDLVEEFSGKTIIIVGAGPSLDDEIDTLKKVSYRSNVTLIVSDMALRRILNHGCRAQYCITCETRRVNYFKGLNTKDMMLLSFIGANCRNLKDWQGKFRFYNWQINDGNSDSLSAVLDKNGAADLTALPTGSVVTTQAFSFAAGCKPEQIIFIGQDLGYHENKNCCKDTYFEQKWLASNNRLKSFENLNWNFVVDHTNYIVKTKEGYVRTCNQMLIAKLWLEDYILKLRDNKGSIYNTGKSSILEKNVMKNRLSEIVLMAQN